MKKSIFLAVLIALSMALCGFAFRDNSDPAPAEAETGGMSAVDHALFDATGKSISENAEVTEITDDVAGIIIPFDVNANDNLFGDDMEGKLMASLYAIQQVALKKTDYTMCLILFEDAKNNMIFGFSVTEDGVNSFATSESPAQTDGEDVGTAESEAFDENQTDKYGIGVSGYDPGQYKVGVDIPSGEYVLLASGGSGYFSVTSDANGNDILFNGNFDVSSIVTVLDGEYITLKRCAAFPSEEFYEKHTININPGAMLKVGYDIEPGEYKLVANEGDKGYYCIYTSSRQDDIVSNENFDQSTYITVSDGQYLLLKRCTVG